MKKLIAILATFTMTAGLFMPVSSARLCGDINGDGEINSLDIISMIIHLNGSKKLTGEDFNIANTYTYDETFAKVDSQDLVALIQYVFKQIKTLPVDKIPFAKADLSELESYGKSLGFKTNNWDNCVSFWTSSTSKVLEVRFYPNYPEFLDIYTTNYWGSNTYSFFRHTESMRFAKELILEFWNENQPTAPDPAPYTKVDIDSFEAYAKELGFAYTKKNSYQKGSWQPELPWYDSLYFAYYSNSPISACVTLSREAPYFFEVKKGSDKGEHLWTIKEVKDWMKSLVGVLPPTPPPISTSYSVEELNREPVRFDPLYYKDYAIWYGQSIGLFYKPTLNDLTTYGGDDNPLENCSWNPPVGIVSTRMDKYMKSETSALSLNKTELTS